MKKIQKIYTSRDAARERDAREARRIALDVERARVMGVRTLRGGPADQRLDEIDREQKLLRDNPQIGVLIRNGWTVYYVNNPEYREAMKIEELLA